MNWKVFTIACVSVFTLFFPANGITCGPTEDPHDYFTSFFSNKVGTEPVYRPFYYTALLKFYDDEDYWQEQDDKLASVNNRIAEEWKDYAKAVNLKDAVKLIYFTDANAFKALEESSRTGKALPDSLAKNSLAQNLLKEKKTEAIQYLVFATKTDYVSAAGDWEDKKRDSLQLNRYIAEATEAFAKATDPFIKNKYAFQRVKLAFYNNRNTDCIRWYDENFTDANTSAVSNPALSYKGGSLFRLGKKKEAAYVFSKVFPLSDKLKKTNFTGFLWATDYCNQTLIPSYTALCKNNNEKATMLAMFALHGTDYQLDLLQQVYELQPSSPLLPLLATREINKLEEQYFTPLLNKEKGGKALYISWNWVEEKDKAEGKQKPNGQVQAIKTAQFFEKLFVDKSIAHPSLYAAGAAYLRFMTKDYEGAKARLVKAKPAAGDEKVKDQIQLINLLIAANENKVLSKEREAEILPSLKWLVEKAKKDEDYQVFCRNFFSQILAQKYEQQGDAPRAALAYGVADLAFLRTDKNKEEYFQYGTALQFIRNEITTENLLKLYGLMTAPSTETEKYFLQYASIKRNDVIDIIGTSHLRDRNYAKAIEWLSKASALEPLIQTQYNYKTDKEITVNVDPFFDYLNDWQRLTKSVATPYTKLTLAKKLQDMEAKMATVAGEEKARLYYQYASALYNMSYYGNSWSAVAYDRSGSDWNEGSYKLPWQKEYYGVYAARGYYQKAYDATMNKEYKAACLFMVAKCAQRQIPRPSYDYNNYGAYDKAEAAFQKKFMNNPLFGKFKSEFGNTKFYQYVYNRCSYLRDYVKKQTTPSKAPARATRKQ
jgi:hypothetical protein